MTQSALPPPTPGLPTLPTPLLSPATPNLESNPAIVLPPNEAAARVGSPPFRLNVTPEELARRYAELRVEMKKWREDESGYDERVWPELKAGLIANRGPEERKLFVD